MARKAPLKRLSKKEEMDLIAAQLKPGSKKFLTTLQRMDPKVARELGRLIERSRQSFARTYPLQTRTARIPNADWAKAGYGFVAEINTALGLEGI